MGETLFGAAPTPARVEQNPSILPPEIVEALSRIMGPQAQRSAEFAGKLQPLFERYLMQQVGNLQSDNRGQMIDRAARSNQAAYSQAAMLSDLMGRSSGMAEGTRQGAQQAGAFASADRTARYGEQLYSPEYDQQRIGNLLGLLGGAMSSSPTMDAMKGFQTLITAPGQTMVPGTPGSPGLLDFALQAASTASGMGWAPFAAKAAKAATGGGKAGGG